MRNRDEWLVCDRCGARIGACIHYGDVDFGWKTNKEFEKLQLICRIILGLGFMVTAISLYCIFGGVK